MIRDICFKKDESHVGLGLTTSEGFGLLVLKSDHVPASLSLIHFGA